MKRIVLLTTIAVLLFIGSTYAQNAFNQNDSVYTYDATKSAGSLENPNVPNNFVMAKWIRSKKPTVTFNTNRFKPYIWNGMPFRVLYPKSYVQGVSDGKKYPVVVFWHGGGEIGPITDNEFQLYNGGDFFQQQVAAGNFDGFFIFPQEPTIGWENSFFSRMNSVLDSMAKYCKVDPDRVTTMGLSIGGNGSFSYANLYPQRVAKIVAASPTKVGGFTTMIPTFLPIPVWMASGGLDTDPDSTAAKLFNQAFLNAGGKIIYDYFPLDDHHTWNDQWNKPYFNSELNTAHKANPLLYFQKNQYCADSNVTAHLALTSGFYAYQWDLNGAVIPGATSADYFPTAIGTYRARFQRTATSAWSDWSPTPVVISKKTAFASPNISIVGTRSTVLPAADGSTTVPLTEASGYQQYRWVQASDNSILASTQVFNAPVGQFKATVMDGTGCFGIYTPVFTTVNANGPNKPDKAKTLSATSLGVNSIILDWTKSATVVNPPTGYEVYRGTKAGGPYVFAGLVPATSLSFTDIGLLGNTTYFYVVRAISASAASDLSNEASAATTADTVAPTAPSNLVAGVTTRSSVSLSWIASTDNVGVYKYDIYVNGTKMFSTDSTKFTVTNLTPMQPFVFVVKARDKAGNISQPSNQVNASSASMGLSYKVYSGYWSTLPNFSTMTPIKTGVSSNLDINVALPLVDAFGITWEGSINIPAPGTYTFKLTSDDGSKIYLSSPYNFGATALINNDGAHDASAIKTATYYFPAAGAYPFSAAFFEQGGGQSIQLKYSSTDAGISEIIVPNSAFTDVVNPAGTVPAVPTLPTAAATSSSKITIGWKDNSNNETGFEIVRSLTSGGTYLPLGTAGANATSYVDSMLNPLTTYYYKIRAVGTAGASAYTAIASVATQALGAPPAAPTGLSLIVNSNKKITINWTDNSGIELGQEIYRSTNDATNYKLVKTVAANVNSYADTTIFPNVTYFYKVRAKSADNFSAYTNEVSGKTLNTKPVVTLMPDFTMKYGTTVVLAIKATDADGDDLSFTTGKPAFATFATTGNGTGTLTFSPTVANQGSYTISVYVADPNGGKDTMRFNLVVNNNNPPVIAAINNITINEGATSNVNLSASDPEGNGFIGWVFTSLPSFATFTNNGNGNGTLALAPNFTASGVYNVSVLVDDGFGGKATKAFTITVNETSPTTKWLVNIKDAASPAQPAPWNNIGLSGTNLINTAGQVTGVGVNSTPTWMTFYSYGTTTGNNSGVYPDAVMKSNMYLPGGIDTGTINVTGLNPALVYNFRFMSGTNNSSESSIAKTGFRINNKYDSVVVKNNTTKTAFITGIAPNAAGAVVIRFYKSSGATTGYVNAFDIEAAYDDGTAPVKATNIAASFIPGTGAKITWKDVAYNETNYKVYRASIQAGPYTQLNPGAVNPNDTSYTDATAGPSATYYYYIVANNAIGNSPSSDTVTLITGNNPPVISALSDLYVKAGANASVNFTVTDDPGNTLTVTSTSLPSSFVTLQAAGAGAYSLVANPTVDNIGFYTATINVADDKGAVTTKTFNIIVSDNKVKTALVKFGGDGYVLPKPWNSFSSGYPSQNQAITNMVDDSKAATTWGLTLTSSFDGYFINGFKTGNNSGVVPDTVMYSGIYVNGASTPRTFKLTGLDNNKAYSIGFVTSINSGYNAGIIISSGSQTVTGNGSYNADILPRLNGLTPVNGEIPVGVLRTANASNAYINALIIQEYDPAVTPVLSPSNLIAQASVKGKIVLNWSDRTSNETGFQVYRSTSYGGVYALLNTTAANVTNYVDSVITANTRYYYKVRAVNGGVQSDNSNIATSTAFYNIEYVNMTTTPVGPAFNVWNNTGKTPVAGDVFALKDDIGSPSGITMTIVNNFTGTNFGGSSTGRNAGVLPDSVMVSNYSIAKGQTATITFGNLDQSKRYRLGFAGSSNTYNASGYNTAYSINDRTVSMNVMYDTIKALYIDNVIPTQNGELTVNIAGTPEAAMGLVNSIVLQSYTFVAPGFATDNPVTSLVVKPELSRLSETVAKDSSAKVSSVVNAFPNPFAGNLNLDITSVKAIDKLAVEIFDSNGNLMFNKLYSSLPSGRNIITISATEAKLSQGVYFLHARSNDGATNNVLKLIKVIN